MPRGKICQYTEINFPPTAGQDQNLDPTDIGPAVHLNLSHRQIKCFDIGSERSELWEDQATTGDNILKAFHLCATEGRSLNVRPNGNFLFLFDNGSEIFVNFGG